MKHNNLTWHNSAEKRKAYDAAKALVENDVNDFWQHEAQALSWSADFHTVHNGKFANGEWFLGGRLNVAYNCLDRHIEEGRGKQIAVVSENEKGDVEVLTYEELLRLTESIASILYERGIAQGDRVAIYMPMIPKAIAAMLACARLGAIHMVVFGGFSKDALCDRIFDAQAKAIITAENCQRKGKMLHLKETVESALGDQRCAQLNTVLVFDLEKQSHSQKIIPFEYCQNIPEVIKKPKNFSSEHPLFILYTSGTTGKPKGLFHSSGGYLTHVVSSMKWVFDLSDKDLFWCTADIGWITGHSYVCYGPLALGKSIFIYDGALNWPDNSRIYKLIEKHKISVLYTAPTAIRMFMQAGEKAREGHNLDSLRLLGSVGEPINPEAWHWYKRVFGKDKCPIIDSWWQTETGAMMISPLAHISRQKAGSASEPLIGISAKIVDESGKNLPPNKTGFLVIDKAWPGMARGIWGDQEKFLDTYFKKMPGFYFTGDGAKIDDDGDFFISGRIDDVVNVAGHRLGTAEIESALVSHEAVAEAAAVGIADPLCGQRLVAFVQLMQGFSPSESLEEKLKAHVKDVIGSFAKPSAIHFELSLPKTRSGKIMRRLLRAKASGESIQSDISTLDDATIALPTR
jgi:acetyl-CoA synthetase